MRARTREQCGYRCAPLQCAVQGRAQRRADAYDGAGLPPAAAHPSRACAGPTLAAKRPPPAASRYLPSSRRAASSGGRCCGGRGAAECHSGAVWLSDRCNCNAADGGISFDRRCARACQRGARDLRARCSLPTGGAYASFLCLQAVQLRRLNISLHPTMLLARKFTPVRRRQRT